MGAPGHDVTELLRAWGDGDLGARDRLLPLVYQELRRRAAAYLRRERRDHTPQPTELVHEAYLRLIDQHRAACRNRGQFFALASQMMRRIPVDRARAHRMAELRLFGGLSLEETREALGLSVATVERDWQAARAWLFKTLSGHGDDA